MDLKTLDDETLDELRRDVLKEQERRVNLAGIPEQIKGLAGKYREGGGDAQQLIDVLTPEGSLTE